MNQINNWGPALIVVLAITIGNIYNNQRITDLKNAIDKRFEDLYRYLDVKFKSLEDRLTKLEDQKTVKER
jgi:hypothetical protein